MRVEGLGFRVQGLGFRVQGLGFRHDRDLKVVGSCPQTPKPDPNSPSRRRPKALLAGGLIRPLIWAMTLTILNTYPWTFKYTPRLIEIRDQPISFDLITAGNVGPHGTASPWQLGLFDSSGSALGLTSSPV